MHIATIEGKIIAGTCSWHPIGSVGEPFWCIEEEDPEPGPVKLINANVKHEWSLRLIGIFDEWAVLCDEDGAGLAFLWSDGSCELGVLRDRDTGAIAKGVTLEGIYSGDYRVDCTVLLPGNLLGTAL